MFNYSINPKIQAVNSIVHPSDQKTEYRNFFSIILFFSVIILSVLITSNESFSNERIVGGETVTDPDRYPWMAALVYSDETSLFWGQFCGATLINSQWIATAAHCVDGLTEQDIDVVLGTLDLNVESEECERISAAKIISHPDFDCYLLGNDIALIKLETPSSQTPISTLADADIEPISTEDTVMATVLGWGETVAQDPDNPQGSSYPSNLQYVSLPLLYSQECASSFNPGDFTENMLCAGYAEGGKDSCQGDSGGPLIVTDDEKGDVLTGIVSWGTGCAQPDSYGVYTRVSEMKEWIQQNSEITVSISLSATNESGAVPLATSYSCTVTGGETPYSYLWDFGDGSSSSDQNPDHTYDSAGTFDVSCTVTDASGNTSTETLSIESYSVPERVQSYLVLTDLSVPINLPQGSYFQVFGSNGSNTVNVETGACVEFLNFKGSNIINVEEKSSSFTAYHSGATVYIQSSIGTLIKVAATEESQTLRFGDGSASLIIDGNSISLGSQTLSETDSSLDITVNSNNTSENYF